MAAEQITIGGSLCDKPFNKYQATRKPLVILHSCLRMDCGGEEFAHFEHWSLGRGQGRPGQHHLCLQLLQKVLKVFPCPYLSFSQERWMLPRQHFGPMLCTVWSCNGHLPNCALHDPKCVWEASRCVWASPGTSLTDKRAVRVKEGRQPSHTIRLGKDQEQGPETLGTNNGKFEHFLCCCLVSSY